MDRQARALRLISGTGPLRAPAAAPHDGLAAVAAAVVRGDRQALRTFLAAVLPHLLRAVRRVLGARHPDVEDVAQESASRLLEALPRFRGESTVLHFACRIAVLTAMNVRRGEAATKRRVTMDPDAELEHLPSVAPLPDGDLATRRSAAAIRALLDTLPIEQAEILALHCVLGYTLAEVAQTAGVPIETARSRLRLAKQRLRQRIRTDARWADLAEDES